MRQAPGDLNFAQEALDADQSNDFRTEDF